MSIESETINKAFISELKKEIKEMRDRIKRLNKIEPRFSLDGNMNLYGEDATNIRNHIRNMIATIEQDINTIECYINSL